MALLVRKFNPDTIQIFSQWQSDELVYYLHLLAEHITKDFAAKMLNAEYSIAPLQLVL